MLREGLGDLRARGRGIMESGSELGFSLRIMADQKATITCTGKNVTLTESSPYLGENSKYSQSLFVLKANNSGEGRDTAFFLDVDIEGDVDANKMIYTVGKNSRGGKFTLKTKFWDNIGDGTVIKEETTGLLTYSHGPLRGQNEIVKCIRQ